MNRCDRREPIFKDDTDRQRFVETLGEACVKSGWQVHAYCLMPNDWLREETLVTVGWISRRLEMGGIVNVNTLLYL